VAPASGDFPLFGEVTITATPAAGWEFLGWSGAGEGSYTGTDPVATITMLGPIDETASFSLLPTHDLTMAATPGGSALPESGEYPEGTIVTITAIPDPGWFWAGWVGEGPFSYSGPDSVADVTMLAPASQTGYFTESPTPLLTMEATEGGTVTPETGGQEAGNTLAITAEADSGYVFVDWEGSGAGSYTGPSAEATITMLGPITQTARFLPAFMPLTTAAVPAEGGLVMPASGDFPVFGEVTITATPAAGWEFLGWSGSGDGSYTGTDPMATVTMLGPISETAEFSLLTQELTMAASPGGSVLPESGEYPEGSAVTITAIPDPGWFWAGWIGEGPFSYTGPDSVADITMLAPATQTGYFTDSPTPLLTMEATEGGTVTPESGGQQVGSTVTITAVADSGYVFEGWDGSGPGSYTGPSAEATITMLGPITQTAHFGYPVGWGGQTYDFRISASAWDPYENYAPPPPDGGQRELFLWATCIEDGLSAMEADVVSTFPALYGFTPSPGVLNLGTEGNLLLAVGGCPSGFETEFLLGHWTVQEEDEGGTLCLAPSDVSGILGAVDCDPVVPDLSEHLNVYGFSSFPWDPPCELETYPCEEIPVSLELSRLEARVADRTVVLEWVTSAELRHAGYHIYRGPAAAGPWQRLTDELFRDESPCRWIDHDVAGGATYYYEVGAVDLSGEEQRFGPVSATTPAWHAYRSALLPAQPNPFSGGTGIRFSLEAEGTARISIFDVAGRLLHRFESDAYPEGTHVLRWDGRDSRGRPVPAGIYFVRLETGRVIDTRKIVSLGPR
jgi:hypothetical protein